MQIRGIPGGVAVGGDWEGKGRDLNQSVDGKPSDDGSQWHELNHLRDWAEDGDEEAEAHNKPGAQNNANDKLHPCESSREQQ